MKTTFLPTCRRGMALCAAGAALATALCVSSARGVVIDAGWDWILTDPGTRVQLPMLADDPSNPGKWVALSSFPYSNPFAASLWGNPTPPPPVTITFVTTWYDPHGAAIPPSPYGAEHAVSQVTVPVAIVNGAFDTVIQRPDSITISGIGTEASGGLRIDWLSLKSTQPISLQGQSGLFDMYVGLDKSLTQSSGQMKLRSGSASGDSGWIDLGDSATPGDENLGLPVNWVADFIPHGLDPIPANVVASATGYDLFQNHWTGSIDAHTPTYVIPEPSPALILALAAAGALTRKRWRAEVRAG